MRKRSDRILAVRKAAGRAASGEFAGAASNFIYLAKLLTRIEEAAATLSPDTGLVPGAALGAQLELAGRMNGALQLARGRVDRAAIERTDAAVMRKAARRALDTAIDMRRDQDRAAQRRIESQAVPLVTKDRI